MNKIHDLEQIEKLCSYLDSVTREIVIESYKLGYMRGQKDLQEELDEIKSEVL